MHDGHVHSRWSWDTENTVSIRSLVEGAARAGISTMTVADHLDLEKDAWCRSRGRIHVRRRGGVPLLEKRADEAALLDATHDSAVDLTLGLEVGEPHLFGAAVTEYTEQAECVLASVHSIVVEGQLVYVDEALTGHNVPEMLSLYFAELERMIDEAERIDVVTHINFPFRFVSYDDRWRDLESSYRRVFRAIAGREAALEINARTPALNAVQHQWAMEEGLHALIIGSDAHDGGSVGVGVARAITELELSGHQTTDGKVFSPG